jgi:hypothetical protein
MCKKNKYIAIKLVKCASLGLGGASTCPCRKSLVFSGRLGGVFTESGQIVIVLADFYGNGSKLS